MPQPTDLELVNNIKANNNLANDSVTQLLDRHAPLYNNIVSKMVTGEHHANLMDDKYYVLFKAATKFDESENVKFSTWFGNYTKYHTLTYLTDLKKEKDTLPLDTATYSESEDNPKTSSSNSTTHQYHEQQFKTENEDALFSKLKSLPDKRIYKIFNLKYRKELNWAQISKKLKVTVTTCINLRNKGRKILKKELVNLDKINYNVMSVKNNNEENNITINKTKEKIL